MDLDADVQFTETATSALDEYLADIALQVHHAARNLSRHQGGSIVNAGLLMRAISEVESEKAVAGRRSLRSQRVRLLGAAYSTIGATILLSAFVLYTSDIGWGAQTAPILAAAGGLMAILGFSIPSFIDVSRQARVLRSTSSSSTLTNDSLVEFLAQWQQFERSMQSVKLTRGVDLEKRTLSQQLARLADANLLSQDEVKQVKVVLQKRNQLVHGSFEESPDSLRQDTLALLRLTTLLRSRAADRDAGASPPS